ncbi:Astryp1, partial [Operophtera brumata]
MAAAERAYMTTYVFMFARYALIDTGPYYSTESEGESHIDNSSRVQAVYLPKADEEVNLGHLASIVAWTPDGAVYLPKADEEVTLGHLASIVAWTPDGVSAFARWTDSVIWDENNRPTTTNKETTVSAVDTEATATQTLSPLFVDPSKFMLTLPYEPVNLPLEPDENNAVMGRVSLYESYLQNMANPKTTTTQDPLVKEQAKMNQAKMEWFQKYGKAMLMMPQQYIQKNFD